MIENIKKNSFLLVLYFFLIAFNSFIFCQDKSPNPKVVLPSLMYLEITTSEEYERYHTALLESSNNKIIQITLDSLSLVRGRLFLYPTFFNNSDSTINILRQSECIRPFKIIIKNSVGEYINPLPNGFLCDVNPRYSPNIYDLIDIEAYGVYHYPKVEVYLYSFTRLPKDEYNVELQYYYNNPDSILVRGNKSNYKPEFYAPLIYTAQITLRGEYLSDNKLKFEN